MSAAAEEPVIEDSRQDLLAMSRPMLEAYFVDLGEKPYRATQMLKWIYHQGVVDLEQMSNISKKLREHLARATRIGLPRVIQDQASGDGTRKWLLELDDGNAIETVFIPGGDRGTLCVSSQVGCALNCSFCSTARQGYNRNLTAGEIIGQLWTAAEHLKQTHGGRSPITNVVMMGMGEPLLNLDNVVPAMELMLDDLAYGLSRRRVTLSTAGHLPGLEELSRRCAVSLAVSLHAPNDALRNELVPLNRKYPIRELLAACHRYIQHSPKHQVTYEYVMLEGINDQPEHARELAALLRNEPAKLNLIPFNPFPGSGYRRSPPEVIERFQTILMRNGVHTITRKTRGDDIDAACGQLAGSVQDRTQRSQRFRSSQAVSPPAA